MTKVSSQRARQMIIALTLLLFVLGYALILKADITSVRNVFNFLLASYLLLWGGYALISSIPRDEIRIQFILITLALCSALFLAEIPAWFKLIDYRKTFSTGELLWEQPGYIPDLELLARPQPHHTVKMLFNRGNLAAALCLPPRQGAEPIELRYDKNGFRNEQDLTTADIAIIGDSYVESPMIPSSMLATTQLAGITLRTVANLGQSGYGPYQELAVLKRFALPLQPKDVVWVFYEGNDLLNVREYGGMVSLLSSKLNSMGMVWDRSFTKNALLWLVRVVHGCIPAPSLPAVPATVLDDEGREQRIYLKGRSSSVSLTREDLDALRNTVEVIREAYRLIQQEGARLTVVFAPTAFRVYHDIARFEEDGGKTLPPWTVDDLPDRLRKMIAAISSNIGYLDLTPVLKDAGREHNVVFLSDDTHWSTQGHRVVAEAVAEALRVRTKIEVTKSQQLQDTKEDIVLSKDAIMIRNVDGTIRYWSRGAQKLYGWEAQEALGKTSHRLLETVFPAPLERIEEELRRKGFWEGQLIHKRRDGSKVSVSSHWDIQENPSSYDQSITVIEVNGPKS